MVAKTLRLATRKSPLALAQAKWVATRLEQHFPNLSVELVALSSTGDEILDRPLREVGGKALFTKTVDQAVIDGRADLAVHSLKDVDTVLPGGIELVAFPEREAPGDVLITKDGKGLDQLAPGSRVGTGALRRVAQLRSVRPDLVALPLRGNINSRLEKLDAGIFDAVILAAAGLQRGGFSDRIRGGHMDVATWIPAPGQGILAVAMRPDHPDKSSISACLDHGATRLAATAERAFLTQIGGTCHSPIGAHCAVDARTKVSTLSVFLAPTAMGENHGTPLSHRPKAQDQASHRHIWRAQLTIEGTRGASAYEDLGHAMAQRAKAQASDILAAWKPEVED